jgi:hypothetical protein
MAIAFTLITFCLAIVFGSAVGVGISFIVNCTLVEIANSTFFAYVNIFHNKVFLNILRNNRLLYFDKILKKQPNRIPKPRLYSSKPKGHTST